VYSMTASWSLMVSQHSGGRALERGDCDVTQQ